MVGPVTGGRSARSRARSDHDHSEQGQATVELALVLPLVFGLLILLFQIAVVARDDILVVHAARDAAREATVTGDAALVTAAARRTLPGAAVTIVRRGGVADPVEVAISFVAHTDLPLVGALLPDVTLHGRAVMRVERP
jgi:TadE-like protein